VNYDHEHDRQDDAAQTVCFHVNPEKVFTVTNHATPIPP
jgi:hypothetical protein